MTAQPRCHDHLEAKVLPLGCPTCVRIWVERILVASSVNALLAQGFAMNVYNGGDEDELLEPSRDRQAIQGALMETGDDFLKVFRSDGTYFGWVRFVYGNSGYDVISDYTLNLEAALAPVNDRAKALGGY